jgi:hypothetical protein
MARGQGSFRGNKIQITTMLDPDDFSALVAEAARRGMGQSGFMRFCVKAVLARNITEIVPAESERQLA